MGNKVGKGKDKDAKKKQKKPKCTLRVLTLGVSGSGKSTFAKQMKIITNGGFEEEEIKGHREILLQNILVGMQELVKTAEKLEYLVEGENRKHCRFFTQMTVIETEWNEKIAEKVKTLWEDPAIQRTWKAAPGYQLQMSHMDYLMNNMERFSRPDYIPTNEDVLRARQRTTGEHITSFVVDKTGWDLIDVGGQKPERAKWDNILNGKDAVNAIIYFGALDEFNMISAEEAGKTKMELSVEVFKEVLYSDSVKTKPTLTIILFLNKIDLLQAKLEKDDDKKQFHTQFPNWDDTIDGACNEIKEKFLDAAPPEVPIKVHNICALDTDLMSTVFKDVRQTIFDSRLLSSGFRI